MTHKSLALKVSTFCLGDDIVLVQNTVTHTEIKEWLKWAHKLHHIVCCSGRKQNMNDTTADPQMKRSA